MGFRPGWLLYLAMILSISVGVPATGAAEALPQEVVLDALPRHIGDGLFGNQCGYEELQRISLWGDRYSIRFRTSRAASVQVRLNRLWGVNPGYEDVVLIDGVRVGVLPVNHDPASALCGKPWVSEPFWLQPGRHELIIVAGTRRDKDDIAFEGVGLLSQGAVPVIGQSPPRVWSNGKGSTAPRSWMEALMETTTVVATLGLLAFLVERVTNGTVLLLGYWSWWQGRFEGSGVTDPVAQARIDRNRRSALFAISAILAVLGAWWANLNFLEQVGVKNVPPAAAIVVTGLLMAAGADPIRELVKLRERKDERSASPQPIQLSGTVIIQQARPEAGETSGSR